MYSRLRSPTAILAVANAGYAAAQWMILSLTAKWQGPAAAGLLGVALAIGSPIALLAGTLRGAYVSDVTKQFPGHIYTLTRYAILATGLGIVAVICLISGFTASAWTVTLLVLLARTCESLSDGVHAEYQATHRFGRIAASRISTALLQFLLVFLATQTTSDTRAVAAAMVVGSVTAYALIDARQASPFPGGRTIISDIPKVWRCLVTTSPLAATGVFHALAAGSPRYLLEKHSLQTAGIFSCLQSLTLPGQTLMTALGNAKLPSLVRLGTESTRTALHQAENRLLKASGLIGAVMGLLLAILPDSLLATVFNPETANKSQTLLILAPYTALFMVCNALGYILTARRVFQAQWRATLGCFLITAGALVMMKTSEPFGAAVAMLIGMVVQTIMLTVSLIIARR